MIENKSLLPQSVLPENSSGKKQAIGLAKLITLGQAPTDTFFERQSKAILVAFLIFFSSFAALALLDEGRSPFVHLMDAMVIVASIAVIIALQVTKSLYFTFTVVCSAGLGLLFLFFLMVGNRGADLMMPVIFPLLSVVITGPARSWKWIVVTILMVASIPFIDPLLPEWTWSAFVSDENPTGSFFHAPFKQPIMGDNVVLAIVCYLMSYGIVYAAYAQMIHARKTVKRQRIALTESYAKSERLLLNILPASVVERLKEDPDTTIADDLEDVVILFADIVDFTKTSANLPASEVVSLLNKVFSSFDHLVDASGLEKIKTSGDAYMVAAGIGETTDKDIERVADLALGMLASVEDLNAIHRPKVAVRVGIHSGLATAGIVGTLKFYYDVWGDTVNLAARLQTSAKPGSIRVSSIIYDALSDDYIFEKIGRAALKGKGEVETYALVSAKPVAVGKTT